MTARQIASMLALVERTDAYTDRPHADLWSGSGCMPSISYAGEGIVKLQKFLPDDAREVEEWCSYPYRVVWRVDSERAHVTYCEGDVSVLIAHSAGDYAAINTSADNFYRRYA